MSTTSPEHALLVELFRESPDLVARLIPALSPEDQAEVTVTSESVPDLARHLTTDLVLRHGTDAEPTRLVVVEAQQAATKRKRYSWPCYVTHLRYHRRCEVALLVVTTSARVAKWAAEPIRLGPLNTFQCHVLGPEQIPIVRDHDEARASPSLAVLSALAHNCGEVGGEVAAAAMRVTSGLDPERGLVYNDLITRNLDAVAQAVLEKLMDWKSYKCTSPVALENFARGREEALEEARTAARALLNRVLDNRGLEPSTAEREAIAACRDMARLHAWAERAMAASTVAEALED